MQSKIETKFLELKESFREKSKIIYSIIVLFILFIFFPIFIFYIYFINLSLELPDVEWLKDIPIAETSIIYDKNGDELYSIYSEKRTYVDYDEINKNMINAIVASEDQRFWSHPWYDIIWITRAVIRWIQSGGNFAWTSGINQQLAKIIYLSNERKIKRKLEELYLSMKLDSSFDKKYILELYLNKVFFWWNSYWVEQASITYFWVKASELSVLEASILASLPKSPTSLSPYTKKWDLLWYPLIFNSKDKNKQEEIKEEDKKSDEELKEDNEELTPEENKEIEASILRTEILSQKSLEENKESIEELKLFINNLTIKRARNNLEICWIKKEYLRNYKIYDEECTRVPINKLLSFLNSIQIIKWDKTIEYNTWRKDYVLWRMFEDKYITFEQYKKAIIESFWFEFIEYKDDIKYPYFVMYVKEYLVEKYWEDVIKKWWLRIYTTLDPKVQDEAQNILREQVKNNAKNFNAKNAALISIDNKTWNIISMVWWVNYYDEENWWYNNMVTSRLQPWSSFKPFVYLLAMMKKWFRRNSVVYDVKYVFPLWYSPNNFDGWYMWKMTLSKALNHSRNIPAVKMYYYAWEEPEILKFIGSLWMKSSLAYKEERKEKYGREFNYSAPMALWTAEVTPLELATAYSVLANNGVKNEISPILRITDSRWNILEEFNKKEEPEKIISEEMSYEMNSILSNTNDKPEGWREFLTIPWRKMAAKTWTSTKQYYVKGIKVIKSKNLWSIWYTPQITTVVWAWNTDWEELWENAFWLTWPSPIMIKFMQFIHKNLPVENWTTP